jgi:hypothetical protein
VAHTCNPNYSRGRNQEDRGSKPVWANGSQDSILKNPSQKSSNGVAQGVGPEFKPSTEKTKKLQSLGHTVMD